MIFKFFQFKIFFNFDTLNGLKSYLKIIQNSDRIGRWIEEVE